MNDFTELIHSIDEYIEKQSQKESKLSDALPDFPGREKIEDYIEEYESTIAHLLLMQRDRYLSIFNAFIAKDDKETLQAILAFFNSEVFSYEVLIETLAAESKQFLNKTVEEFASIIMDSLDKEVPFRVLSKRSVTWIEDWSDDLAELMNLSTQKSVEKVFVDAIKDGKGIDVVEQQLMDLPDFDRKRARRTAITEILTASSVAHQESYSQSPSVKGKRWKHSGNKGITPRANHMELDGTVVPVDEPFTIPNSGEKAMHPRDTNLSAKERVNCHCVLGPDVDEDIFGLSAEEKEALRQEALAKLNK